MGRLNFANLKKTIYYLQRNGLKKTWYAVWERLDERKAPPYQWTPVSSEVLEGQRRETGAEGKNFTTTFSILVPAYRTKEEYLRGMIDSLLNQSYSKWELILADATPDESVAKIVRTYTDERIRYVHLAENVGIAGNTNQALQHATGDYVGLLDHDDVLTLDALYEMALQIEKAKETGTELQMLYSDEDKCNGDGTEYYEPHFKEKFNLDLLLNNNYICHFMVMKREMMQELKFRSSYDGAQDFDLVLRAASKLMDKEHLICHIPKVLYHWRCHTGSTAENPQSKMYAYEAGKRAVQDFADNAGWMATVEDTPHVGFYKLNYHRDIFEVRPDVIAVGGPLISRGKITGGRMDEEGNVIYEGLSAHYSGYMHRAVLQQDAECVDVRNMQVCPEYEALLETVRKKDDPVANSVNFSKLLRATGRRIVYLPDMLPEKR